MEPEHTYTSFREPGDIKDFDFEQDVGGRVTRMTRLYVDKCGVVKKSRGASIRVRREDGKVYLETWRGDQSNQ